MRRYLYQCVIDRLEHVVFGDRKSRKVDHHILHLLGETLVEAQLPQDLRNVIADKIQELALRIRSPKGSRLRARNYLCALGARFRLPFIDD